MDRRTRAGLNILGAALLLGVLGDALLRATPWGVNVLLWASALLAALCFLHARWRGAALTGEGNWLVGAAALAAAAFAWRDSPTLRVLDAAALSVALALVAWRARGRSVRLARLFDYVRAVGGAGVDALLSALPLAASDVRWQTIPRTGALRHAAAVARGLLISVPLLAVFGALLMAADAVFDNLVREKLHFDAESVFAHALTSAALAWCVAGLFRGAILANNEDAARDAGRTDADAARRFAVTPAPAYTSVTAEARSRDATDETPNAAFKSVTEEPHATQPAATPQASTAGESQSHHDPARTDNAPHAAARSATSDNVAASDTKPRRFALGAVEVGTALGLLDLLFAAFVLVQVRYFFGGAAHVVETTGLTYSEYARRGFFELVWVAALALPLLLAAHSLLRRDSATVRLFRALAAAQVALLFVIMASAVARMRLYQSEYGLTELRLYTTAFMLWLGLVFVWFGATVLWRERRERFACGALVSAALVVGALHLLNPDAYIVRANAAHARRGRAFDAAYARALSADAAPALLAALPALPRDARCSVASNLLARWLTNERADWRTWNVARTRARQLVAAQQSSLEAEARGCLPSLQSTTPSTHADAPPQPQATGATLTPATTTNLIAPTTNPHAPTTNAPASGTTAIDAPRSNNPATVAAASHVTHDAGAEAPDRSAATTAMKTSEGRKTSSRRKAARPDGRGRATHDRRR